MNPERWLKNCRDQGLVSKYTAEKNNSCILALKFCLLKPSFRACVAMAWPSGGDWILKVFASSIQYPFTDRSGKRLLKTGVPVVYCAVPPVPSSLWSLANASWACFFYRHFSIQYSTPTIGPTASGSREQAAASETTSQASRLQGDFWYFISVTKTNTETHHHSFLTKAL